MIKLFLFIILSGWSSKYAFTQPSDSSFIVNLNQHIDDLVVGRNTDSLTLYYGDDFVFSHGSGKVEGREGWLRSVAKGNFISRSHDSVRVYRHQQITTVTGKLSVEKKSVKGTDRYNLKYVRVYALRNGGWQMVSHITTWEAHEK